MQWTEGNVSYGDVMAKLSHSINFSLQILSLSIVKKDVQEKPYPEEDAPIHSEHDRTIYNSIAYDRCK